MKLSGKSILRTFRKSKIRQIGEAKLLEFHRNQLLLAIHAHEKKRACKGLIRKLFAEKHPGHFESFKKLVAPRFSIKNFRPGQVRVYRLFVDRLIKETKKTSANSSATRRLHKDAA